MPSRIGLPKSVVKPRAITIRDLRDRALLGVFVYTFAGVSAVVTMKVRDYRVGGRRADLPVEVDAWPQG